MEAYLKKVLKISIKEEVQSATEDTLLINMVIVR